MRNLYIDFDGVVLDTISVTYKILNEMGVSTKEHDKVSHFYQNLNWKHILKISPELNESIDCIKKIMDSNKFNVYVLTHVNSLDEAIEKVVYIRKYIADVTVIPVPRDISKTSMARAKDAILIDDYSGNLKEWEEKGGIGLQFSIKSKDKGFKVIDKLDEILKIDFDKLK